MSSKTKIRRLVAKILTGKRLADANRVIDCKCVDDMPEEQLDAGLRAMFGAAWKLKGQEAAELTQYIESLC